MGPPLITSAGGMAEIGLARRAVAAYLMACRCQNIADAVLVASELITNAVLHGDGADRIAVVCDQATVHVTVHDSNPAVPVVCFDPDRVGGRGLRIVEQLAQQWGVSRAGTGKKVWAILARDADRALPVRDGYTG